ncbi:BREX system ATP-binding domain-containing protein [Dictyobacter halimunensis]|uniref:BREX system ATP-binding domain-containing protein n=1 Tax=Dictyobacter halimunensis TaxID=3026934 RepID=UPI003B986A5F
MRERKISPRHGSAILQAFSNGVTPRIGLEHVIVGRSAEIEACQSSRSSLKEKFLSREVRRKPMTATARSAVVIHPLKRGKI